MKSDKIKIDQSIKDHPIGKKDLTKILHEILGDSISIVDGDDYDVRIYAENNYLSIERK